METIQIRENGMYLNSYSKAPGNLVQQNFDPFPGILIMQITLLLGEVRTGEMKNEREKEKRSET
jgi:hypothetical protein